jgi:putative transposase
MEAHSLSERKSCSILHLSRTVFHYRSSENKDADVIEQLNRLAGRHPGYGFWKMYARLRIEGYTWNHKKVYRIYTALKLNIRRRHKRRLPTRKAIPIMIPEQPHQTWSMDFISDALYDGRRVRVLNIIDDYNRQALAMEVGTSIPASKVIALLEQLTQVHGKPMSIRTDNGPEFLSHALMNWCHKNRIQMQFIQPGKPMQNGLIERFNGTYRKEILDAYVFYNLRELQTLTSQWMQEYNSYRPHESLGGLPPEKYVLKCGKLSAPNASAEFTTVQHINNNNNENEFLIQKTNFEPAL